MKIRSLISLIIMFIANYCCFAQEVISPLEFNPVIHRENIKNGAALRKINVVPDTLVLPFLDDFSEEGIYPSTMRWTDNKVFINSDFARNMPTVGVATFDGLNEFGNPYVPASSSSSWADTLTSVPIYLHTNGATVYSIADSIFISFFYEKKGFGDGPEGSDSLVLEYKHPTNGWIRQWSVNGGVINGQDTVFTRVIKKFTDPTYLFDGFQFRFRSYGNVSGNLDHWHLDYVQLFNTNSTGNTEIRDVAFKTSSSKYLLNYTSVPWSHYKNYSDTALLPKSATLTFINYNDLPRDIGFNHRSYDIHGDTVGTFGAQFGNILGPFAANQNLLYTYPKGYKYTTIPEISADSNYFEFYDFFSNLGNANNVIRTNDTIHYRQNFFNYYSYDDGTCEVAHDLFNTPNGKVAMKFDILQSDGLRGVQIFFARQNAVVANKLMTIKVWSSLSPETVIYQQTNMTPRYIDSINGFAVYVFSSLVNVPTTFYIGFQQVAGDGLHLGFDKNTVNNSRMYFSNTSGTWSTVSAAQGTFMIRPFVGDTVLSTQDLNGNSEALHIFPNPAVNFITIDYPIEKTSKVLVNIADIAGRNVYQKPFTNDEINISFLKPGVYLLHLQDDKKQVMPVRFIKY